MLSEPLTGIIKEDFGSVLSYLGRLARHHVIRGKPLQRDTLHSVQELAVCTNTH